MKNIRIGDVLIDYGYIDDAQLEAALAEQKKSEGNKRIGTVLVEMGFVSEKQVLSALGKRLNLPVVELDVNSLNAEVVQRIPKQVASKYCVIAISEINGRMTVAINDPLDFYAIEDLRQITNMPIALVLAEKAQIELAISHLYSEINAKKATASLNETADAMAAMEENQEDTATEQAPVVQLVNNLLMRGFSSNASDIHIEPFEGKTKVRMRIDGMMIQYVELAASMHPSVIARIKILADLDIAEKRAPQDGHFRIILEGKELNIRVSVIPTVYGEKAVLRFLTTNTTIDHLGHFGFSNEKSYQKLLRMMAMPHGIVYITGPTGSGKTTTLYMALERLSSDPVNISTIEDPVERNLLNINQMQVNPMAGVTFDSGLRALLRQDPDIIMVGETRDAETASISMRAAITGHLVFSTLHTNDAISSIVRLADMELPPYLIANSLVGLVAQRLVRKVCDHCGEEYTPSAEELAVLGSEAHTLRRGKGCSQCNQTGYRGRIAVHEVVEIDKTIRRMITERKPMEDIERYAVEEQNMETLKGCVRNLVLKGATTIEEMMKITCFEE